MLDLTVGITVENLENVYSDAYISRKVKQDHRKHYPVFHELATYLSAWCNGEFIGAYLAIRKSSVEFEIHSLLKKEAIPYSRELGDLFLQWLFSHDVLRVTAPIIKDLTMAKNYAMKFGFVLEGTLRHAVVYKGKPTDVVLLGLLKSDWENTK